jgi:hypothetical protein
MITKQRIVAAIGEATLSLPALVEAALAANDRLKYRLTLLQFARRHADAPGGEPPRLVAERVQAGIADASLDDLPGCCSRRDDGAYRLPGLHAVLGAIDADLRAMLAPLQAAAADGADAFAERAGRLLAPLADHDDEFTPAELRAWTHGERGRDDGVHVLVMDLHRALTALQASIATEIVDGASTYALAPADVPRVRAFMRGLARTSPLRFDHPGLGTTATRSGDRLVLQNDIGTTDAHVLVIHVEGRETSFTYTDVHLQRLLFLQAMFDGRGVRWDDARLVQDRAMEDGLYHLVIGRHVAPDDAGVESFLEYLGSRLVFLIDWNRARKQLRRLVGKKPARRVLEWAAAEDVGHMAFLRVGGADAVLAALGQVVGARGRFGQTLEDVLGAERAEPFLRFALRMATEALLTGRAEALVVDEYRAELARQARSAADEALDLAADHVGLVAEIAAAVREAATCASPGDATARLAVRCKQWESDADRVLLQVREVARRAPETAHLRALVERSDDVADDLEECAFLLTLLDGHELDAAVRRGIAELAGQLLAGTRELVRITELLRTLPSSGAGDDVREFLDAIHRIGRIEHDTDAARRQVLVRLVSGDVVPRALYVAGESAAALERAADYLQHAAYGLRDAVLERAANR